MKAITPQTQLEINDLLVQYCHLIDDHNWPALAELFTPDAHLDFSAFQGPTGTPDQLIAFFQSVADVIPRWQHTISTSRAFYSGDSLQARTAAQVMMITKNDSGQENVSFSGLWYEDTLIQTGGRWQFSARKQIYSWSHPPSPG